MQSQATVLIALALCCSVAPGVARVRGPTGSAPTAEVILGDAAAFEKVSKLEEQMAEKDVAAINKAAKIDEDSAAAMEAKAATMLMDAKAMQQVADGQFKDEDAEAQKLRESSKADAAAVERGAELERANKQADSLHLRQVAVQLEEAAIEKEKSAEEEQEDAAGVEAQWLQNSYVENGDAKALRFVAAKTQNK